MIKLEERQIQQMQSKNFQICLSPFCFNPQNRLFSIDSLQSTQLYCHNKEQCAKWVISIHQLFQPIMPYKPKQFTNLEVNFKEEPIQALKKIARLDKSDWKKHLTKQINIIKKQVNNAIELLQQNVMSRVTQILSKKSIITEIKQLVQEEMSPTKKRRSHIQQENISNNNYQVFIPNYGNDQSMLQRQFQLTNSLNKYFHDHTDTICQLKSVHFLQKISIKEDLADLKKKIQDLQKTLIEQKSKIQARTSERIQFYEWMFQKDDNMFNKLQLVGNLFNTKQQNYHIEKQTITINCMFCQKYVQQRIMPQNLKQKKKFLAEQLNIHMYNQHHDKIFYSYLRKVSKTKCKEITIAELMVQLQTAEELHLIDRETGVSYTEDFVSSDILSVDILTKKNVHLAKNNHILINSKQTINSFVSILAYECSLQKKKLLILSSRFEHIEEISKIFSFANVHTAKKYDGLEHVKFQEEKTNSKMEVNHVKKNF